MVPFADIGVGSSETGAGAVSFALTTCTLRLAHLSNLATTSAGIQSLAVAGFSSDDASALMRLSSISAWRVASVQT